MTALFFNLLVNSAFSMICGLLVVGFFIWLFRVQMSSAKFFLLSLPFLKIVYDCARGVPPESVLLAGLDPFSLPPHHQILMANAGFSYLGPVLTVVFAVKDINGAEFAASVGDYMGIWLNRRFGSDIPFIILSGVLTVSLTLIATRLFQALKFEKRRRMDRKVADLVRIQLLKYRKVEIYISQNFSGTPFTGGLFRPYICIPKDAYAKLELVELEAVIAHELGHVSRFDLLTTVFVLLLGDIFWFVPGYRWLSRKIDRLREIVADQWAVASGVHPAYLASALVKLKEIPKSSDRFVLYSAFFREKSLLKVRVERLIGATQDKSPRFGWQNRWFKAVFSVWIFTAVMFATLGGNHSTVRLQNPQWFENFLNSLTNE